MTSASRPVANCCVLAVPSAEDVGRLRNALHQIARLVPGDLAPEPHVTLAYYYHVTDAQLGPLGTAVAELAVQSPPLVLQASRVVRDLWPNNPNALIFEVDKTPPMAVLYEWLRRLGIRQGLEVSPEDAESWVPHIKVLDAPAPIPAEVTEQIDALAPQVHFTATHLALSYRGETETWKSLATYPLAD